MSVPRSGPTVLSGLTARSLTEVAEGAVADDATFPQHHGPVDQRAERPDLVQHHEYGRAGGDQVAEQLGENALVFEVDAGGRLVEDEEVGLPGQSPRDQYPLLLAAGQVGHVVAGTVGQPDPVQGVSHGLAVGPARRLERAAPSQSAGGDDFTDLGAAEGCRRALRHVADTGPGTEVAERRAEQLDRAPLARRQPEQGAYEGRLA